MPGNEVQQRKKEEIAMNEAQRREFLLKSFFGTPEGGLAVNLPSLEINPEIAQQWQIEYGDPSEASRSYSPLHAGGQGSSVLLRPDEPKL
jgi:hypothetical protein